MRKIRFKIENTNQLNKLDKMVYMTVGDKPFILLDNFWLKFIRGWVSFEFQARSESNLSVKLYLDYGKGFSEANTLKLIETSLTKYKAEFFLNSKVKSLKLVFTDKEGVEVEIKKLQLTMHGQLLYILKQFIFIIMHDLKRRAYPFRIVEKSYARYKKHGRIGMLERLDKEYRKAYPSAIIRSSQQNLSYKLWIQQNEKNQNGVLSLVYNPLISVIVPTYNTSVVYLEKCIESVLGQTYTNFELCIADDASTQKETLQLLKSYENNEKIKIVFRKKNGHISNATNSALELANGEYIAFLDHDDMLAPHALVEVVKVLNVDKDLKLIYSDEDKVDEYDNRYDPHFKSGWNPDMFFSQNYISHLTVLKKEVISRLGGLRVGYEGAQDYDLLLRSLSEIKSSEIAHIEKILYHWRAIIGSTALDTSQKDYTTQAGLKALRDFFRNKDKGIQVHEGLASDTYKVSYPLPKEQPLVTLLIPTRDGYDILSKCVESILEKTTYENYEIIILDNQTSDSETLEYFEILKRDHSNIKVLKYDKPFNYSAINNFGVEHAQGEIIGLINNDIEVISNYWLTEMVQHALRPEIGAVGAMLYYDNDTIQHAGVVLVGGVAGHSHKYFTRGDSGYFYRLKIIQDYSAVTAACLLVRKELYLKVGGLDEEYLKVAFNDVDFCLKLGEKGYRNLWTPYAELYHHESISRGSEDTEEKMARAKKEELYMQKRWSNQISSDVYYNSNLTKKYEDFSLLR